MVMKLFIDLTINTITQHIEKIMHTGEKVINYKKWYHLIFTGG